MPGVLGPSYTADLAAIPIEDLRARRDRARQTETDLSYLRRIVQGRLDIVASEQERRGGGGEGAVTSALPDILADDERPLPRGSGVFVSNEPSMSSDQEEFLASITPVDLTDLGGQPAERLVEARLALQGAEAEISRARREVHEVLDACAAELTRRYREGEADVSALLLPPAE